MSILVYVVGSHLDIRRVESKCTLSNVRTSLGCSLVQYPRIFPMRDDTAQSSAQAELNILRQLESNVESYLECASRDRPAYVDGYFDEVL